MSGITILVIVSVISLIVWPVICMHLPTIGYYTPRQKYMLNLTATIMALAIIWWLVLGGCHA